MQDTINILHLRASEGGGGGPEKTIFKTALHMDASRFWYGTCYLRKHDTDLAVVAGRYREKGLPYFEIPGTVFDWRQLKRIADLIKTHQVRILHSHDAKTIVYGVLLKLRFPGIRLATTLHGWVMRRRRSRFYQWISELGLRLHHAVVAVSDDLERKTRKKGISRVCRIHNAIDLHDWPLCTDPEENTHLPFTVGYIGRISPEKGPGQFLKVAGMLAAVDDEIRFRMVGEGPLANWVEKEVSRMGLDGRFTLMGHVPQDSMPEVYGGLSVLLSTSHTEGMPNTFLEAGACGVPVVATRVGGVGELISNGYNGFLAEDGDTVGLARAVLILKQRPELCALLSRNGRDRIAEEFSFSKRVVAMEHLYETLARKGSI